MSTIGWCVAPLNVVVLLFFLFLVIGQHTPMARVLVISSQFCFGQIGLRATVPMFERAGHEVIAVPTVVLSNDPNFKNVARLDVSVTECRKLVDALSQNGHLANINAIFVGYLPTVEHGLFATSVIDRVRVQSKNVIVVCDPILGDDPGGLYIDRMVAEVIGDQICPKADIITPNRFELSWLSQKEIENTQDATKAARAIGVNGVLATSVPASGNRIQNLWVTADDVHAVDVKRRREVPHGPGDVLAASFLARILDGISPSSALDAATQELEAILDASEDQDTLRLWPNRTA